ncbi:MAG: Phosphate transport system permease protein PstA [Myxococcaceae bacterium]|nr:Phosphate transport system permease protein PstA [Myxococcaceae bacterium]
MAQHQVLFCPFCHESFEHQRHCPEHELELVPFDRLASHSALMEPELDELDEPLAGAVPAADRPLSVFELRHGRGAVALGALLNLLALGLPLIKLGGAPSPGSVYRLAHLMPSLWTLLLVSFTVLFVLARRRTPRRLRSLRVLVPWLALLSPVTLAWGIARFIGVSGMVDVGPGSAVYVVAGASLLLLVGGLRLGGALEPSTGRADARLSTRA